MWIVEIALKRRYTFLVLALIILLATPFALFRMPVDILPEINIPVVSVVWTYNDLSAEEVGQRITSISERSLTTTVDDIEHIESQSLPGIAVIKIFFQPTANIQTAIAQLVSISQAQLRQMPTGITPPLIIKYTASSIPVIQLGISSDTMTEQALFDATLNFLRPKLVTIPGAAVPYPYGGKQRVLSVDLDIDALQARGMSPIDVVNGIAAQNLLLPSGTLKMGELEHVVHLNSSPDTIAGLGELPLRTSNGVTTLLKDVANVRDGYNPQINIIRQDGQRGVLVSIIKNGTASTMQIVDTLKALLPAIAPIMPPELKIRALFDQSLFVKAAIDGVMHEGMIAACLTAAMILLFLGNWRSTLIIAVSIPLSIMCSILALKMLGETINLMTLGGLALAVGILVDDATVTIENIERHLHMDTGIASSNHNRKDFEQAIRDGAGEIAVPALVSTLAICIVFLPMFFLTDVARYLFVPLAEAVIAAMLASYVLSRTLVPTLVLMMLRDHTPDPASLLQRLYRRFDNAFERMRQAYRIVLLTLLHHRSLFAACFLLFCMTSCALYLVLGQDFFPSVDAGKIRLHLRAPTGTRLEETAAIADRVDRMIRQVIDNNEIDTLVDNIGVPNSGINLSYSNAGTIGPIDAEILIALKPGHQNTRAHVERLREALPAAFPGVEFFFQPADIVTQILNFGLPAAIDIQFVGKNVAASHAYASSLMKQVRQIPGTVDVHILQRLNQPGVEVAMDRLRAQQMGFSATQIAQSVLISLAGSFQTSPSFWLNPANGILYNVAVQTPPYRLDTLEKLLQTPVSAGNAGGAATPQLLGNLATITPARRQAVVSHYDISPVVDLYIYVSGRDLGSFAAEVQKRIDAMKETLPKDISVVMRGQVKTMQASFVGLGIGLAMAIVLVYLLIVINFQSWVDAFIIITALPGALAGIAWMLFLTGTTLSVPALTGTIMTMGVATANAILVVAFARQQLDSGVTPLMSALEAGTQRIRPVLMTALAMIIGLVPMALGLGEGAEQNAPLGRATIGGLLLATVSTLFFVPVVFAAVHHWLGKQQPSVPPQTETTSDEHAR